MKRIPLILSALIVILASALLVSHFWSGQNPDGGILIEYTDSSAGGPEIIREYGIPVDSFVVESGIVARDQTLSGLLRSHRVPAGKIEQIVMKARTVFDPRKIRAGRPYKFFCTRDSAQSVQYFVYEHSPVKYLFIELDDTILLHFENKAITNRTSRTSGVIVSSLWNAMLDKGLDPMLAFDLSEIYAWSIDFFGLQRGDAFKVIFDEQFSDTTYVGLGHIQAACFRHAGHDYYALPFEQDSVTSFYDRDGNSLRKAFLKAPLRYSRISSRFSYSRLHPILKIRRPHLGVDYAAPVGTPVYAIGDGEITRVSSTNGSGNMVRIRHNSVYSTAYLHLSRFGKGIGQGRFVKQGQLIGYVGSSGLSTGPHLDFRFYKNGRPVDPLRIEAPPVEPVKEEYREKYDSVKSVLMMRLDSIEFPSMKGDSLNASTNPGTTQTGR